ncbi:MAG: NAD(P)/FAD-dependent oxidoreductase [Planctomycetales bacterium]|nr:NAD(P)/FAD-dependent oxidoreductase [Planctomycetales bacterium]
MAANQRWAIVGGGMMGLSLAHQLTQDGQSVSIIEASHNLGGLADAWQVGDITWDRHYHVILLSDSHLREFLEQIGLQDEFRWVETKTGFFTGGRFYSMSNTAEFLMFPPLNLIQKFRLGGTIFLASKIKNWRRMESVLVEKWLTRWSGKTTFQKMWLPLLRAKLGDAYQRTSAAFIWAYISRMYKARRTGLKKEMFGYIHGGYARIIQRLEELFSERNVAIHKNSPVAKIQANDPNEVEIQLVDGSTHTFDKVIMTTSTAVVDQVCPDLQPEERRTFADIEYLGIVCASVVLNRPLNGYYVTNITDDVPFTAVIEMTTIVQPSELNGHTLVYLPKYVTADDPIVRMSDEQIQTLFLDALRRMYPDLTDEQIVAFKVSRVRDVMALPTLDYSQHLPPIELSVPNVYAINSAHIVKGNLNVNETIEIAKDAYSKYISPVIRSQKQNVCHGESLDQPEVSRK